MSSEKQDDNRPDDGTGHTADTAPEAATSDAADTSWMDAMPTVRWPIHPWLATREAAEGDTTPSQVDEATDEAATEPEEKGVAR